MWLFLFLTTAGATGDGFAPVKEAVDCAIAMRDGSHAEGAAMRATCHWPEVDPARAGAMMADLGRYDEYIWPIAESRVERRDGGRALVFQRQHIWGMTDRVVLLWVTPEVREDGATIAWEAAADEPLTLPRNTIRTPKNSGRWDIRPHADGGAAVVHEIAIQAGGPVLPRWLLNLIRTRGFISVMRDVRKLVGPEER